MAKKSDEAVMIVEEPADQVEPAYEVGEWAGLKQWRCLLCAFDTLDGAALLEHLVQVHHFERVVEV